jgi:hypothetical protein
MRQMITPVEDCHFQCNINTDGVASRQITFAVSK